MKLSRVEAVSLPGGQVNHDHYGYTGHTFWVMDGATPLSKGNPRAADEELCRLVKKLDQFLRNLSGDMGISLREIMAQASGAVRKDLESGKDREPWEMPSCAVAAARVYERHIEYFLLGDVVIALKSGEDLVLITDDAVKHLDRLAIEEKLRLQVEKGLSSTAAREGIVPILQKNRALMNKPGGYWIFNGDPEAVENAQAGAVPLTGDAQLLLATDGFSRLVEVFRAYPSWPQLLEDIRARGLEKIARYLRQVEESDLECLKYPRFSPFDDATAIYVELRRSW